MRKDNGGILRGAFLTRELLKRIEEVSDIKWIDGDPPTSFQVRTPAIVNIERGDLVYFTLAQGSCGPIKLEKARKFVELCSEICPKKE